MRNINIDVSISSGLEEVNFDSIYNEFNESGGVCVIADGKKNKGILSDKWAEYLCANTKIEPLRDLSDFERYLDENWEGFYEDNSKNFDDNFLQNAFENQGSYSTYTACWLSENKNGLHYQWLSYGNSGVLIYDEKKDELLVPEFDSDILGFLSNSGLVNWRDGGLNKDYFLYGEKKEFHPHIKIILATDAMAEHLALMYLIIKSREDDYWGHLKGLMRANEKLSNFIYRNRGAYSYNTFNEVLKNWEKGSNSNFTKENISLLQKAGRIAEDDVSIQIISCKSNQSSSISTKPKPKRRNNSLSNFGVPARVLKPIKISLNKQNEFKPNKEQYLNLVKSAGVTKLFHFTDKSNLKNIRDMGGLYSWDYLVSSNINIPAPGGDNLSRMLDSRYKLENFVRTSFCSNHPMMYVARKEGRITDPVILEINPEVIALKDTMFSNMNATKKGHKKGTGIKDLKRVDFNICLQNNQFDLEEYEKAYYQSEVMVKQFIPSKYIMNLNEF